jgi:dCMP deaminase
MLDPDKIEWHEPTFKPLTDLSKYGQEDWLRTALRYAYDLAQNSPDRSTQNAALIVDVDGKLVAWGVNEYTRGMEVTEDLHERPKKYAFIEHAERNAIFHYNRQMRLSKPTQATTMIAPWAACADCARAIVQSGITELVRHVRDDETGRWGESIEWGDQIMRAAGIRIVDVHGELGGCTPIRFAGEPWAP